MPYYRRADGSWGFRSWAEEDEEKKKQSMQTNDSVEATTPSSPSVDFPSTTSSYNEPQENSPSFWDRTKQFFSDLWDTIRGTDKTIFVNPDDLANRKLPGNETLTVPTAQGNLAQRIGYGLIDFGNKAKETAEYGIQGIAKSLMIPELMAGAFQNDGTNPKPEDFTIKPEDAQYISPGTAQGAEFVGNVFGLMGPTVGAGFTGGRLAGGLAAKSLRNAPESIAKYGTNLATGLGTGLTLGTGQELIQEGGDPNQQDFLGHLKDIGETGAYFGAYGLASPFAGSIVDRAAESIGRSLPTNAQSALNALNRYAPVSDVAKGVSEGLISGGLVGAGMGALELAKTGDLNKAWDTMTGESGSEMQENLVESIAYGMARRLSGRFGIPIKMSDVKGPIQDQTFQQLPDHLKNQVIQSVNNDVQSGVPLDQAKDKAIESVMNTPEGFKAVLDSTKSVEDTITRMNQQNGSITDRETGLDRVQNANPFVPASNQKMDFQSMEQNAPEIPSSQENAPAVGEKQIPPGDLYNQAVQLVAQTGQANASMLQQRLKVDPETATNLMNRMEQDGLISSSGESSKREINTTMDKGINRVPRIQESVPPAPQQPQAKPINVGDRVSVNGKKGEYTVVDNKNPSAVMVQDEAGNKIPVGRSLVQPIDNQFVKNERDVQRFQEQIANQQNEMEKAPTEADIQEAKTSSIHTLPPHLSGAKPRYNYRDKKFSLNFTSDIDKALYIVGNTKQLSKHDAAYMGWLKSIFPDKKGEELRKIGQKIRDEIKRLAKESEPGTLDIPDLSEHRNMDTKEIKQPPSMNNPNQLNKKYGRAGQAAFRKDLEETGILEGTSDYDDFVNFFEKYYFAGLNGQPIPKIDIHPAQAHKFYEAGKRDAEKSKGKTEKQTVNTKQGEESASNTKHVNPTPELKDGTKEGSKQEQKSRILFQKGDRVSFERNGKTLTGTVHHTVFPSDKYISVDVDQIATYGGGVPIGRIEMVWLNDPTLKKIVSTSKEEPKQELAPTEESKQDTKQESAQSTGIRVTENEEKNGIEIRFEEKPSDDLIRKMKARGFRYSGKGGDKRWYARRNPQTLKFAYELIGGKQEEKPAETKQEKKEPDNLGFQVGDQVKHNLHGKGTIESLKDGRVGIRWSNGTLGFVDAKELIRQPENKLAPEAEKTKEETKVPEPKREPQETEHTNNQLQEIKDEINNIERMIDQKIEDYRKSIKREYEQAVKDAQPLWKRIKEHGGIAPSKTGAWKQEYNESVPLYLKNKDGLPLDEMASELGMSVVELVNQLRNTKNGTIDTSERVADFIRNDEEIQGLQKTLDVLREELRKLDKEQKGDKGNEPRVLRTDGSGTLEEVPSNDVSGAGEERTTSKSAPRRTESSGGSAVSNGAGSSEEGPGAGEREHRGEDRSLQSDQTNSMGTGEGDHPAAERGGRSDSGRETGTVRSGEGRRSRPHSENVSRRDFVITNELNDLGGAKTKFRNNVEALRLLHQIESEERFATPEEQAILAKYVGWGGLAEAFDDRKANSKEWGKEYNELKQLVEDGIITQEEYETARSTTLNAHYTSPVVVKAMYKALERMGFKGGRVLEPSMGTGNFFGLMPVEMAAKSSRTGVEIDPLTGRIAKQLYQKANINIKPFENYKVSDGFFDVAIGNVPFGSFGVVDPTYKKTPFVTDKIHNYFFIKSLDKVRDGGIVMFITSSGTLNSNGNKKVRELIAEKADFLGAVRLPSDAFKANAGTEVTTDIIVLQKRPKGQPPKHADSFINTVPTNLVGRDGKPMTDNEYFVKHPEMVLGEYVEDKLRGNRLGVKSDGRDLEMALNDALEKLPANIYEERSVKAQEEPVFQEPTNVDINSVDEGGYTIVDGKLVQRNGDQLVPVKVDGRTQDRIRGMIKIRDAARKVLQLQRQDAPDEEIKAAQKELNKQYDLYVKRNGYLNEPANLRAFQDDPLGSSLLRSLEKNFKAEKKGKQTVYKAEKEAIFTERTIQVRKTIEAVDNADEALIVSLYEKGRIDWQHMSKLTGKEVSDLILELDGKVFENPNGTWETADEYLSGNVRQKLVEAEEAAKVDPRFKKNVEALKAVQPEDLLPHQISVRLGAPWIPETDIEDFINEFLGTKGKVKVKYIPQLSKWKVDEVYTNLRDALAYNTKNTEEFGVKVQKGRNVTAINIIENALNLKQTTVTYKTDDEKTVVNVEATNEARAKQKQIQDIFQDWIWSDEERAKRLAAKYNWEFNNTRLREYDGELIYGGDGKDAKPIPGMNTKISLRKHQKNAVWRIVQGGNTLLAHVVGAGKTWTMVTAGMEMKRMGLINKPMYVVPNHLLDQWEAEFKELYPGANVLKISNEGIPSVGVRRTKGMTNEEYQKRVNENRAARAAALSKIAVGKYDAILITHSTFQKIPMSPQAVQEHIREQIADLEIAIRNAAADEGKKGRTVKELENAKKNLENKIKENLDEESKDVAIPFEELGIDQIFVDEAHMFKNLKFYTKMHNVAGLPQSASKRAQDMFLKTQWLTKQRGGRGVVFATGTPISNTMAEMYTMQRYLQMDTLRERGIAHFDAWAAIFGESVTGIEMDATGKFKQKTRFARFHNVAELMTMFRSFADIQTADMINLPGRPEKVERETIVSPMSDAQRDYLKELADRALAIKNGQVTPEEDNYLKLTGDGRKAALDIRMVRPDIIEDYPDSKVNKAVEKVFEIWRDTKKATDKNGNPIENLTQLIFLDLGTPKKKKESDDEKQRLGDEAEVKDSIQVYDDIRAKLMKKGIPKNQIAFIHDAKTDAQRKALFDNVRKGNVRILIGSTEKMGAGMNVQDKLIALHHLDAPWRPADVEQREGRIIRQGNKNDPVKIFTYTTEGSFDALMWDTLKRKATFIAQVMNGKANVRSLEDVEELVMGYAQVAAVTTGNPLVMEKFEIDQKVMELQSLQTAYERNKRRYQAEVAALPGLITHTKQKIENTKQDQKIRKDVSGDNFSVTLNRKKYDNREEAGKALIELAKARRDIFASGDQEKIGTFAGFDLYLRKTSTLHGYLKGTGGNEYIFDINYESPTGTASRLINALNAIDRNIDYYEDQLIRQENELKEKQALVNKPFDKSDELKQALQRQAEILKQLIELDGENRAVAGEEEESGDNTGDLAFAAPARKRKQRSRNVGQSEGEADQSPIQEMIEDTTKTLSPKAAQKAAKTIAGHFGTVIRRGHVKGGTEGVFNTKNKTGAVRDRSFYEWRVVGHELGHVFSDFYDKWSKNGDKSELMKLYESLYPGKVAKSKQTEEGFAEFFRIWVVDPEHAAKVAPVTKRIFEEFVANDPYLSEMLSKVRTIVDNDLLGTPIERAMGSISFKRGTGAETHGEEYKMNRFKRSIFEIFDYTIPAQDLMKEAFKRGYVGVDLAHQMAIAGDTKAKANKVFESIPRDHEGRFIGIDEPLAVTAQRGIDMIGEKIGWKRVKLQGFDDKQGAFELFSIYLLAKRVNERYERGFEKLPMTKEEAEAVINYMENEFPDLEPIAEKFTKNLSRIILDKLERAGILTPEARERIERGSHWYIPFFYDHGEETRVSGTSVGRRTNKNPAHRFKGETAPVLDFYQATMLKLAEVEQAIEYKRTLETLTDLLGEDGPGGLGAFGKIIPNPKKAIQISPEQLIDKVIDFLDEGIGLEQIGQTPLTLFIKGGIDQVAHEPIVMNVRDGKQIYIQLAPDLFKSLMAMKPIQLEFAARALAWTSRITRYTALVNPRYMFNALTRDIAVTVAQSKAPIHTIMKNLYTGVGAALRIPKYKELVDAYIASGGHSASAENVLSDTVRGAFKGALVTDLSPVNRKKKNALAFVVDSPHKILRFLEEYPRLAEWKSMFTQKVKEVAKETGNRWDAEEKYNTYLKEGTAALPEELQREMERILTEVTYASSEVTVNFRLHGANESFRKYMPTVPFLHGQTQGMYRFVRNIKENPKRTAMAMAALSFLSVLSWLLMASDDDKKRHMRDMDSAMRDKYWWLPGPDGTYFAIAKPFEYALASNMLERFMDWAYMNDKGARKAFDDYGELLKSTFVPGMIPSFLKTALELYANESSLGGPIVPLREQGLSKELQAGPYTSQFAIGLAKLFAQLTGDPKAGPSPRQVDYFIKQMFGGFGSLGLKMFDKMMGVDRSIDGPEYGVFGAFLYGQAEGGSRIVEKFYQDLNKADSLLQSANTMAKNKITQAPSWATPNNLALLRFLPAMQSLSKDLAETRKELNAAIEQAKTPEERHKLTLQLDYVEKLVAGIPYGVVPEGPHPESGITDVQIQKITQHFVSRAQAAMAREAKRAGGATEAANYLEALVKKNQ